MTRKKYSSYDSEDEFENEFETNSQSSIETNVHHEKETYENELESESELQQELENFKWWSELSSYPELHHLRLFPYSWFEELLETGQRPESYQCQFIFADELAASLCRSGSEPQDSGFEPKPLPIEIEEYGINHAVWRLIQ